MVTEDRTPRSVAGYAVGDFFRDPAGVLHIVISLSEPGSVRGRRWPLTLASTAREFSEAVITREEAK